MKLSIATILFLLCLAVSTHGADRDDVIDRFYSKLLADQPPGAADETEFFGTKNVIKLLLQQRPEFRNSNTPVWDFLRRNKFLFIPLNYRSLKDIIVTQPFDCKSLGSQTARHNTSVLVFFVSDRNNAKSGFRSILFTLGDGCLIDIEGTYIRGIEGVLLGEYVRENMSLKDLNIK